jgi:hypothetical protein
MNRSVTPSERSSAVPNLKTQEVEGCSVARPSWDRCDGHLKCLHRFLVLRKTVEELMHCAVSGDGDYSIVSVQRDV